MYQTSLKENLMKVLAKIAFFALFLGQMAHASSSDYECKDMVVEGQSALVCFPIGYICKDPHGIGDGVAIETDCWDGGSRACHNGSKNWPACAGGIISKKVDNSKLIYQALNVEEKALAAPRTQMKLEKSVGGLTCIKVNEIRKGNSYSCQFKL
jgi:hypothetical protein